MKKGQSPKRNKFDLTEGHMPSAHQAAKPQAAHQGIAVA
jgi:hypothetical protein